MSEFYQSSAPFINPPMDLNKFALGMEYLGGAKVPAGSSGQANLVVGLRRSTDTLLVICRVTSLSSAGSILLRFNGDSAANYSVSNLVSAPGQSTFSSNQLASANSLQLQPITSGLTNNDDGGTGNRIIFATFSNTKSSEKAGQWLVQRGTGVVTAVGPLIFGAGNWVNTAAQINTITMFGNGLNTMGAESGIAVFGKDLP